MELFKHKIFCIIFDILSEKDFELFTIQFLKIFMPLLLQENGKNNKLQNPSSPLGLLTIIGFEFSMKLSVYIYCNNGSQDNGSISNFESTSRNPETRRHELIPCSLIRLISLYHISTLKRFKKKN